MEHDWSEIRPLTNLDRVVLNTRETFEGLDSSRTKNGAGMKTTYGKMK